MRRLKHVVFLRPISERKTATMVSQGEEAESNKKLLSREQQEIVRGMGENLHDPNRGRPLAPHHHHHRIKRPHTCHRNSTFTSEGLLDATRSLSIVTELNLAALGARGCAATAPAQLHGGVIHLRCGSCFPGGAKTKKRKRYTHARASERYATKEVWSANRLGETVRYHATDHRAINIKALAVTIMARACPVSPSFNLCEPSGYNRRVVKANVGG